MQSPPSEFQNSWGTSPLPVPKSFQCKEQAHNIELQQQLNQNMANLHAMEVELQAESFKVQQLEQQHSRDQCIVNSAKRDLFEYKQKLEVVTNDLHDATQNLARSEQRSKEQWAAVIRLASLLPSQVKDNGEILDVAGLFMENGSLRRDLAVVEYENAKNQDRTAKVEVELRTRQTAWEKEVEMWRWRDADLTEKLQSEKALVQEFEASQKQLRITLYTKDQQIASLSKQMPGSQSRRMVGPVPSGKDECKENHNSAA